jgi:putative addiction module CopG family antidote
LEDINYANLAYDESMEVRLTPEQEEFIRHAVEDGRFSTVDHAIGEALTLLEHQEQALAELRSDVDAGLSDLEEGRFYDYTDETLPQLIEDIRRDAVELHARRSG